LDDLRPAVREFHALVKAGIPAGRLTFALNHIGTDAEEADARAFLEEAGYFVLTGYLPERPAYRRAQNAGHSVTETKFAGLNARADALMQALVEKVNADG
jgi:chromosome partitioning protein